VELEAGSKGCTARLYGEVDIASRKFVEDALVFALENSGGALTVDLDTLDFMDSQGIHMLRRLRDEANKSGAKLKVRSGLGVHRKLLELGGIRDVIDR
jgi:anti-anti-sigma factor